VPGLSPAFVLLQMSREIERYRYWYFGLVTNTVPNPVLWVFQAATIAGTLALAAESFGPNNAGAGLRANNVGAGLRAGPASLGNGGASLRAGPPIRFADRSGPFRLLILVVGSVLIFAAFINNKVPVYMPHLLIGFSLAAGFIVDEAARLTRNARARPAVRRRLRRRRRCLLREVVLEHRQEASSCRTSRQRQLSGRSCRPDRNTSSRRRSSGFPFHAEIGTTFYSYAAAQPIEAGGSVALAGVSDAHPTYLVCGRITVAARI